MQTEPVTEQQLDAWLADADPFDTAVLHDHRVRSGISSLRVSLEEQLTRESPVRVRRSRYRGLRWAVPATFASGAAVLVGSLALTGGGGTGLDLGVPAAAAAQLRQAARLESRAVITASGQWAYTQFQADHTATVTAAGFTIEYTDSKTEQVWDSPNGSQRARIVGNGYTFATAQDKATYVANQAAFDAVMPDHNGGTGLLDDSMHTSALPTQPWETSVPSDPRVLLTEIWSWWQQGANQVPGMVSPDEDAERPTFLWNMLSSILLNSFSAQLRATAYSALALIPGTTLAGSQTDALGRTGVEVKFVGMDGTGGDVIVSPITGDLLQMDATTLEGTAGLPAGATVEHFLFLQRGLVNSSTALPDGGTQPVTTSTSNG